MRKLIDVSDQRTRLLQLGLMAGSGAMVALGASALRGGSLPPIAGWVMFGAGAVLLVVSAGIRQRWQIEYRGHEVRFENSPVTGERLYLDGGLVARGGIGSKMELRAPIRVGDGAGEEIVALVDAGLRTFRVRLFADGDAIEGHEPAPPVIDSSAHALPNPHSAPATQPHIVTHHPMLGPLVLAKHALEFLASMVGLIGGAIALWTWMT